MKRLNGVEKGVLLLAAIFVVFGFFLIFYPQEMVLLHQKFREHISPKASQIYGALAIFLGGGIGWAVLTKRYD